MKLKKMQAMTIAAAMVLGSGMTAFADDTTGVNGATGQGTAFEHVDKDIIAVTLPTTAQVADVFNFYVDPEGLIKDAGSLADGTTAVDGNDDGVYFKNTTEATGTPAVNASVTAYNIANGGSAVTSGLKITVPASTAATSLVYKTMADDSAAADGWYDGTNKVEVSIAVADGESGSVPVLASGDTITVSPYQAAVPPAEGTPAVNASVTAYSIKVSSVATTSGLTVTVPPTTTATALVYCTTTLDSAAADGWYVSGEEGDATKKVNVTVLDTDGETVVTPESGDTITVSPYQAAVPGDTPTVSYGSSSDAVAFEGKNSVAVDVSVKATVTATAGNKDIALVADAAALTAAKTPALLLQLKVGDDIKAITSSGATAKATIEGVPDNFAVTTENNKFVYKIRTDTDTENGGIALDDWNSTTVQLIGKTNSVDVTTGMTAPQVALTWTVAKSAEEAEEEGYVSATSVSVASKAVTLTMPEGVTVSKVELVMSGNVSTLINGNHYTVSGNTLNIAKYAAGWAGASNSIKVTYSDGHVDTLTCE